MAKYTLVCNKHNYAGKSQMDRSEIYAITIQSCVYVPMHTYACTYVQLVAAVKLAIL